MVERAHRITDVLSPARQGWIREQLRAASEYGASVDAFAARATRGERLTYWEGHLALDREVGAADWARADILGKAAMRAYEHRAVTLVQQRTGPGVCRYIAVKL